jgi:hypothetical protein
VAARIREWRAAEAKRLQVPTHVVLHGRTVAALGLARPGNPKEIILSAGMSTQIPRTSSLRTQVAAPFFHRRPDKVNER